MKNPTLALLSAAALCAAGTAQASFYTFAAALSGAAESPVNDSLGTGNTVVTLDDGGHLLTVHIDFTGLTGTTTAAHVHCCTAVPGVSTVGVATALPSFVGFPLGVTSGIYDHVYDTTLASSWGAGFITANGGTPLGAEAAFLAGMLSGRAYLNLHSTYRTGGEIRGFLAQVPEPATLALAALGLFALTGTRRRQP